MKGDRQITACNSTIICQFLQFALERCPVHQQQSYHYIFINPNKTTGTQESHTACHKSGQSIKLQPVRDFYQILWDRNVQIKDLKTSFYLVTFQTGLLHIKLVDIYEININTRSSERFFTSISIFSKVLLRPRHLVSIWLVKTDPLPLADLSKHHATLSERCNLESYVC